MKEDREMKEERKKKLAYVPPSTTLNFGKGSMPPPITDYEQRRHDFDREAVKSVVKGNYGANS